MNDQKQNPNQSEHEATAGAHQEGKHSVQAGQTQRREQSPPEQAPETGRSKKPSKYQSKR